MNCTSVLNVVVKSKEFAVNIRFDNCVCVCVLDESPMIDDYYAYHI